MFVSFQYRIISSPDRLPRAHGTQSEAPRSEVTDPGAQSVHSCWPPLGWNFPGGHCVHSICPLYGCTDPGAQGLHVGAPVPIIEVPAGQSMHEVEPRPG